MEPLVPEATPVVFVRSEVAEVVPERQQDAPAVPFQVQAVEERHELQDPIRLEQQVVVVDRVPHRDRDLELPVGGAGRDDAVVEGFELVDGQALSWARSASACAVRRATSAASPRALASWMACPYGVMGMWAELLEIRRE